MMSDATSSGEGSAVTAPDPLAQVERYGFVEIVTAQGGAFAGHAWRRLMRPFTLAVWRVERMTTDEGVPALFLSATRSRATAGRASRAGCA